MYFSDLVKEVIIEELRQHARLGDEKINQIIEGISSRLQYKRQAIVATFLTDQMYEAMLKIKSDLDYSTANSLYKNAIKEYNSAKNKSDSEIKIYR